MARKKASVDVTSPERGSIDSKLGRHDPIRPPVVRVDGEAAAPESARPRDVRTGRRIAASLQNRVFQLGARVKSIGETRNQYVSSAFESPVAKVVDVGCSYGWALHSLRGVAQERWGIDTDAAALRQARASYPDIHFVHGSATRLPFSNETFDAVILSETIEHVPDGDKSRVMDEIHRVLKAGGLLVFTAPYAGLLAWADPLDLKRRLPSAYRLYMRAARYSPATPLEVGHKHLSAREISALFRNRFDIEEVRFCGFVTPFVTWILVLGTRLHLLPRRFEDALNRFRAWESGVSYGARLAFNVRLLARKRPT